MRPIPLIFAALALVAAFLLRRRLGWLLVGVVAAFATLLAVYGSGAIELPTPEEAVEEVGSTLGAWTYLLVGGLAFLEAAAFIGLIAPGELAVVFGGIIAGRGDIDLFVLIGVVWFAAVAGDLASYTFGRVVGRGWAIRRGRRFGITEKRLEWAERYFESHGGKTIVIGRFVGLVRALTPFIAGTSRMPLRRFLVADVVGAGLWASAFCTLGYVFWQSFDRALDLARRGKLGLGAALVLAVIAFAIYRLVRHSKDRRRLAAWLRQHTPFVSSRRPTPSDDSDEV
jgi:membrane protein DedA with SNARE-associated domain